MADPVIKPDDTVRAAADLQAPDLEGLEGRWLDVPRLQQRSTEVRSNYWCGRTSAAMIHAYYSKAAKKTGEYIGHTDGDKGPGSNGGVYNLRFLGGSHKGELAGVTKTGLCHPQGVFETAGWKSDSGELAGSQDVSTDEPEVVKRFSRHIDQLKKNNPIVQFTQLTKNRGHIVVINGYKKDSDRGELWLRIVDPCYPHEDLLGAGNYKMITRPKKPDHEFSEYWVKARRLLEIYPGRKTRLYAHGDSPLGHFFYAIPAEPVKDDDELVHKIGKGLGDAAAPSGSQASSSSSGSGSTSSGSGSTSGGAAPARKDDAPAAACPPLTGVPRLPYSVDKSSLVTANALTSLYHQSERGQGGFFPLGDNGLFHCGAHVTPATGGEIGAMADGELVAARIDGGPGAHPWGNTGFVLLRHLLTGDKKIYCLYLHLQREPLHPDKTKSPWLTRLLIAAMEDKNAPKKPKWRVLEPQPTWKDEDKGKFSPVNVQVQDKLAASVYEEDDELVQDHKRYVKLSGKWVRAMGPDGNGGQVVELSPWADFDLDEACKNDPHVQALRDGKVAVFDDLKADDGKSHQCLIEAGETVGLAGTYHGSPSLHWSVFSKDAVFPAGALGEEEFKAGEAPKVVALDISSKDAGTKEAATALIEAIDPQKKVLGKTDLAWIIQPGELRHFYRTPTQCWRSRYQAVKGLTEHALDLAALTGQDRFKSHTDAEKTEFQNDGKAFLFWNDLSAAEEFPADGKAVFVHPVTALRMMSQVRLDADHDDPPAEEEGTNADDRTHAAEDVVLVVRDAKGPLAGVDVTVKADGAVVLQGKTDSMGEIIVSKDDVLGKEIEISLDESAVGDKGQLVGVSNETGAPGSLTPGNAPGNQTFNGDELVPEPRLNLPMKVKTGAVVTTYSNWNAGKFEPEAERGSAAPGLELVAERIVFRKDDGTYELIQALIDGVETYCWSIEDGTEKIALDLPAEKQTKDPAVFASWSARIAHLEEHPVLAGRVLNIDDGTQVDVTWLAMMTVGAPEHDHEVAKEQCTIAAGGFAIAFDPHVLTSDAGLLNTPRPVIARLTIAGKEFALRDQAITIYGDAPKFPDKPEPSTAGAGSTPDATGKSIDAFCEITRDDATDKLTGWSNAPFPVKPYSQLTGAVTHRLLKGDATDVYFAAVEPSQHLAFGDEVGMSIADALNHHASSFAAAFPDAPDWVVGKDPATAFAAGNGLQTGFCASDCKTIVAPAGRKAGCTEQVRQANLGSCKQSPLPACSKVVQLGKSNLAKAGCPEIETACAAAQHDKSHCFLSGSVKGDGAEERERWHVRLPMRTAGAGYPYLRDSGKNARVVLINPSSGAAVVCSQEARGPIEKVSGNAAADEAGIAQDELKDKDTVIAASYETYWKLGIARGASDAVVLIAFVSAETPLGPLADGATVTLKKTADFGVLMGDRPPVTPGTPGDKVKSSNITVAGKHFVDWFNQDFKPQYPGYHPTLLLWKKPAPMFPSKITKASFCTVFDNVKYLWADEISLQQFLGFFGIFYNETGGSFAPIGERGSEKYMFEPTPGGKASYNKGGNRPAGDLLKAMGAISDDLVPAWNGTIRYPDDTGIIDKVHECDFWKFRGHGLIQLTFRSNYKAHCEPALKANGYKSVDEHTAAELEKIIFTDPKIYLAMVKSFFNGIKAQFAKVEENSFVPTGRAVSGQTPYGELYEWRILTLMDAMQKAGFEFR